MIEDPVGVRGQVGGSAVGDEVIVNKEFYVVGGPLDRVEMEGGVDGLACGEGELCGDGMLAAIAGAVEGAVDLAWGCRCSP